MLQVYLMITYVIYKISVLLGITRILKQFLRTIIDFLLFTKIENIKENIIKNVSNLFRLKQLKRETTNAAIKGIRNIFRLKKENKAIKDRLIRDIRYHFEHEEKNYYKPIIEAKFRSNNYIKCKSKGNRKKLSVEKYFNRIRPYLKDIVNNLKESDTWKIQSTRTINFIFLKIMIKTMKKSV